MGFIETVITLVIVGGVLWFFMKPGFDEGLRGDASGIPPPAQAAPRAFHWPSLGDFDVEVVGEASYFDGIRRLVGNRDGEQAATSCVATLVPEDGNKYDDKAVCVFIEGTRVGYLGRDDARIFRRRLGARKLTGASTTCDAVINWGGKGRGGEQLHYAVCLDLKPFDN